VASLAVPLGATDHAAVAWFIGALFALAFVMLALVCWRAGRGLVSRWSRLRVAILLAATVTVPALPLLLLGGAIGVGVSERVVVPDRARRGGEIDTSDSGTWERVAIPPDGSPDVIVVVLLWFTLLNVSSQSLRLPRRLGHLQQLPPVSDPAFKARIGELAARLSLRVPLVVETASVGGAMELHAFTAGMLAPVVVVSDGIVHRLRPAERDAILAHELAHLRHRSVQKYLAAIVLVSIATVLLSGQVPFYLAMLWWLGSLRFTRTLVGHRDEIAADLAAARCVGFAEAAAALDKVHAAGLQLEPTPWFHAVLSHPALAVRAFHLARAAPAGERERIDVDAGLVLRCIRARRIGVLLWTVLLALEVLFGVYGHWDAAAVLGVLLLVVPLLPYLAFVRELRDAFQLDGRMVFRRLWRKGLRFCAMVASVIGSLMLLHWTPKDSWLVWLPFGLALACILMFTWLGRRARRVRRELQLRLLQRDLPGYLERFGKLKGRWRRQPEHRLQALLVRAALGEREAAVAELQRLQAEWPRFRGAQLWAVLLLGKVDPQRGVVLARDLLAAVPGNAIAEGMLATALRRSGAVDEGWQRIQKVLQRRPKHGSWHAAAARIALVRGDRDGALAALAQAERLDPGGTGTVLARAEVDVATTPAAAAASVQRLREVSERLPLAFLGDDLAHLENRLAASGPTPAGG